MSKKKKSKKKSENKNTSPAKEVVKTKVAPKPSQTEEGCFCPACAHKLEDPEVFYCPACGLEIDCLVAMQSPMLESEAKEKMQKAHDQFGLNYAFIGISYVGLWVLMYFMFLGERLNFFR